MRLRELGWRMKDIAAHLGTDRLTISSDLKAMGCQVRWDRTQMNRKYSSLADRIEINSEPDLNSGCWIWSGCSCPQGYGKIPAKTGHYLAHRASYAAFVGEIPDGLYVCHRCDTPSCVNPAHLFLGTAADNNWDKSRKGRARGANLKGETNPQAKLSPETVARIRSSVFTKRGDLAALARDLGVSHNTVTRALRGSSWSHLSEGAASC